MPTAPTPVTAAPTAPDRADRSTFNSRATAWADYQKVNLVPEINALADNVYDNAVEAANSTSNAATSEANAAMSEANAATSESNAALFAQTAVNAPGTSATSATPLTIGTGSKTLTIQAGKSLVVGMSVKVAATATPTNWMFGDITAYDSVSGSLTVNVTATNGSGTESAWTVSLAGQRGPAGADGQPAITTRSARTSNTMLVAADKGKLIDITSGTFTQTFDACATLGDGWNVWVRNSGSGDITLDPNASETIDGLTSFIMYPGEARLVQCDGTALRSMVIQPFYKVFTSTANFIKPPGYSCFEGFAWSAGASGGVCGTSSGIAIGGGGGGCMPFALQAAALAASETVTIGAGGSARAATGSSVAGLAGGATTFGSFITVTGGATTGAGGAVNGLLSNVAPIDGFSGSAAGATPLPTLYGGSSSSNDASANSASSLYGGAAGGSISGSAGVAYSGGTSKFGGNGGTAGSGVNGTAGTAPGGGGGACRDSGSSGVSSGAGARGEVRIWGVC